VIDDASDPVREVLARCPVCAESSHVGWVDATNGFDAPLDVDETTDAEFTELVEQEAFDGGVVCSCGAWLLVSATSRAVTLDPVATGLAWIHDGVPLTAALARVWPTRWTLPQDESPVAVDLDAQLTLELLWLTRDPRLEALLDRCASRGSAGWKRTGPETWEPMPPSWSIDPTPGTVFLDAESFEDSLATVCPTPPPFEAVVAAAARNRTGAP
jgi:hypothetical protein